MKYRVSKQKLIELLVIVFLGLIPVLWFQGDKVILGHDAGLTLSPITHFQDRLHAWTNRFGYGGDQTYAISGFFIHGLEALISSLNADIQTVQKVTFIFWFVLPGLTMFYLASYLEKRLKVSYLVVPTSVLYMINHFLLQGWFVAERTKFSLYAALPLLLVFLFKWQEHKLSTVKTGVLISTTLFILNGMASLPLFGGIIVTLGVFILFYYYEDYSLQATKRLLKLVVSSMCISVILNAYWLIPYFDYLTNSFSSSVEFYGGLGGILGWLDYLSQNSSFANIFILQGIPEWYQNADHPYANVFLNNPILVAIASVIPICATIPLLVEKDPKIKKIIIFFMVLGLISMIFIAGSHPPFGIFYTLMVKYVPGFIAFRSPFYKFSPALLLAYSVLIGYTIQYIRLALIKKSYKLAWASYATLIIAIIVYSYPLLNGSFFDYIKNTRSMRVSVPSYVYEFEKWATEKENSKKRILMFPPPNSDNKVDTYTWGYWSLAPLTTLLANNQIINESGYMSKNELELTRRLYQMIDNNDPAWIKLANFLKIDSLVIRYDFAWNTKGSPTRNPQDYAEFLKSPNVQKSNQFGEWHVYKVTPEINSDNTISLYNSIALFSGENISSIATLPIFDPNQALYVPSDESKIDKKLKEAITTVYVKPKCIMCDQQWKFTDYDRFAPILRRGSVFYPIVKMQDKMNEERAAIHKDLIVQLYAERSLSNILSYRKAVDENEPPELLEQMLTDHNVNIGKLSTSLNEFMNSEDFSNDKLVDIATLARSQRMILLEEIADSTKQWNSNNEKVTSTLQKNFFELDKIQTNIEQKVWRSPSNFLKRFFFSAPTTTQYAIMYRPNTNIDLANQITMSIDGKEHKAAPKANSSGWVDLGSVDLTEGDHKLEVQQPLINMYRGSNELKVESTYAGGCQSLGSIRGEKNDIYRVTFNHQRLSGKKDFSIDFVEADSASDPFKGIEILNPGAYFDRFSRDFVITDKKESTVVICNRPAPDENAIISSILVKDVVISKLNVPDLVLYSSNQKTPKEVKITNIENAQVKHRVTLQGETNNQVIVLNQSYSENWKASGNTTKFLANGYANGWILADESQIVLEYTTENKVRIGFIVSGVGLIIVIIFLARSRKHD